MNSCVGLLLSVLLALLMITQHCEGMYRTVTFITVCMCLPTNYGIVKADARNGCLKLKVEVRCTQTDYNEDYILMVW